MTEYLVFICLCLIGFGFGFAFPPAIRLGNPHLGPYMRQSQAFMFNFGAILFVVSYFAFVIFNG